MRTICTKCRTNFGGKFDGVCAHCRTNKQRRAYEQHNQAFGEGYAKGEQFPNLTEIACPYRTDPKRSAWIKGMKAAHQAPAPSRLALP